MRGFVFILLVAFQFLFAKTTVVSRMPEAIKVIPTNDGALIQWQLNLPDTALSFNNGMPYGVWAPHLNQALGCVFDLSAFPGATLEQIDFLHYSRQKMHGPYLYRILFFDMDSSKLFYTIDSLQAGDSYEIPRFEIGVPLGSIPARPRVGIFIEGLSSPDGTNSFPALMTDSSDYIPGISYYLTDVKDPFLASDPNYTNFYELSDVAQGATNLVLDLWINTGEGKISAASPLIKPLATGKFSAAFSPFNGILAEHASMPIRTSSNGSVLDGFYIYRGNTTSGDWQLLNEVGAQIRQFVDTAPFVDSSYFYAVSSFNESSTSFKKIAAYYQPAILKIKDARADQDGDFIPDLQDKIVAVRGTVVSPNFSNNLQIFINDAEAGIQLYSSKVQVSLNIGDSLFVYGRITQFKGLTELKIDSLDQVQVIGQHEHPPLLITLQDVNETNEGRLVAIENLHIVNPADWPAEGKNGYSVKVTDGQDTVKLYIDKDTDLDGWTPPAGSFKLIALIDQYTNNNPPNDGYELRPRSQQDFIPSTAIENKPLVLQQFDLRDCYPNPFNPVTTIEYVLPRAEKVLLKVFNVNGQLIQTPVNAFQQAGVHRLKFWGKDLPSGIYFVSFKAGTYHETQKIVLIK